MEEEHVKIKVGGKTLYVPKSVIVNDMQAQRHEEKKPLSDKRQMVYENRHGKHVVLNEKQAAQGFHDKLLKTGAKFLGDQNKNMEAPRTKREDGNKTEKTEQRSDFFIP